MNAPQKRHNKREKEGIWRRSFTKMAILKYSQSTFLKIKQRLFVAKGLIFTVIQKTGKFNEINLQIFSFQNYQCFFGVSSMSQDRIKIQCRFFCPNKRQTPYKTTDYRRCTPPLHIDSFFVSIYFKQKKLETFVQTFVKSERKLL